MKNKRLHEKTGALPTDIKRLVLNAGDADAASGVYFLGDSRLTGHKVTLRHGCGTCKGRGKAYARKRKAKG